MTPAVTVIIPTHNRPALLREALASVCAQTWPDWEALVIDDGSEPAVDAAALTTEFGERIRVIRNPVPMQLVQARDMGVALARGVYVIQLDDDDLLAPTALTDAMAVFAAQTDLEVLFIGVQGFGARAPQFDENQRATLDGVLARAQVESVAGLLRFGSGLFSALLDAVPMAFQRALMPRENWFRVSRLRLEAYGCDPDIHDLDAAIKHIQPPLRDSEWALYAAAACRTALLDQPLYRQRCDGQGYVSQESQRERAHLALIDIKRHLLIAAHGVDFLTPWRRKIRANLAATYFNYAYFLFQSGQRRRAYAALARSCAVRPGVACVRQGLRMLLPVKTKSAAPSKSLSVLP